MTGYVSDTGVILPRASPEAGLFKPAGGSAPGYSHRLATPGSVWGQYPLAAPPQLPIERRTSPFPSARRVAKRVSELLAGPEISVQQARWALACDGISEEPVALALACVARHYERTLGLEARPNQLQAAAELLNQKLVELATGQGKSLAAALAAAVAALAGAAVHVLTANQYLARRDHRDHQPFFAALGLTVASAIDQSSPDQRREAFRQDVCYVTARTVAFDFLRDQSSEQSSQSSDPVLRGLCFAIVDEADSLLIDEASMPLVLSEQNHEETFNVDLYTCLQEAGQFINGVDFDIEPTSRQPKLRPEAMTKLQSLQAGKNGINERHQLEVIQQALAAHHVFKKNQHYIVKNDEVLLIDANTGRAAPGRVLPGYLHALICILEGVKPPASSRNRTGLTYPRFFARYHHLCGLSGTLIEARRELRQCYGLDLRRVEPHQRSQMIRYRDRAFSNRKQQFTAAIRRAKQQAQAGRAVLIGTDNVGDARRLAGGFARAGIKASLLDAATEEFEARRISMAGRAGQITISTQIAGRGTDIQLEDATRDAGGLHVLNLQHNRSGRIDRQMAGRAARQGDAGSWEHWIVLDDSPFDPRPAQTATSALRWTAQLMAQTGTSHLLVKLMQQLWQWQDRSQRYARLRADIRSAQSLQISTMKHL